MTRKKRWVIVRPAEREAQTLTLAACAPNDPTPFPIVLGPIPFTLIDTGWLPML